MGHKSLWQVGLSYLDHCPNDGTQMIELLLPRIFPENESKCQKILREAKHRGLQDVGKMCMKNWFLGLDSLYLLAFIIAFVILVQSVCKVQGMVSLRRGRLGNALCWAVKSQDPSFTSFLADKFLEDYIKSGKLSSKDLLDNLGCCMLVSDRLIFLGKL